MLVELRDVEVYIEPDDILIKALEEGDISTDRVVSICLNEEGADEVLKSVDNDDIKDYCLQHDITTTEATFESMAETLQTFNSSEKAQLLWLLLRPDDRVNHV